MSQRPIIWITISWIWGNVIFAFFAPYCLYLIGSTLLMLAALKLAGKCTKWLLVLCILACLLSGLQRYYIDKNNVTKLEGMISYDDQSEFSVEVMGTITSQVSIDGDRVQFSIETNKLNVSHSTYIEVQERMMVQLRLLSEDELEEANTLKRGDDIKIVGMISRPATENNRDSFNYREYLRYQHIHWLLKAKGIGSVEQIKDFSNGWNLYHIFHYVDEGRSWFGKPLDLLFDSDEAGYLKGLIIGVQDELDPEQYRSFSKLGLTHILAISGLHVAVFIYCLTGILRLLKRTKEEIITILIISIPIYIAFTGGSPSVIRAGLMAIIGLLAARAGKLKDGLHIISFVALVLLVINPYYIHNVSFQLSFIVTLGLIIGVPSLRKCFPSSKKTGWLYDLISVTVTAQCISFPITIYYFNQFHILSLLANFLLVPFISFVVLPLGTICLVLGLVWIPLGKPFAKIVSWSNHFTFETIEWLGQADLLHTIWATPPIIWIICWYAVMFVLFKTIANIKKSTVKIDIEDRTEPIHLDSVVTVLYERPNKGLNRPKIIIFACCISLIGLLVYAKNSDLFQTSGEIQFIDVGQGDAVLIRTPEGKIMLIDGGGTIQFNQEKWKQRRDPFEVGKKVLVPLLMKRGIDSIDYLVFSHLDTDHIGGLIEVIEQIPVKEIWWNGSLRESKEVEQLMRTAISKGIAFKVPEIGESVLIDQHTSVDILWPMQSSPHLVEIVEDQNEQSLVMLVHMYNQHFLFTGDIGFEAEQSIIAEYGSFLQNTQPISIMKAAHHGSRYSTGDLWLSYVKPLSTVISVGEYNTYGHPHPDTLQRLEQYHSYVWRTDTIGEIQFLITSDEVNWLNWRK